MPGRGNGKEIDTSDPSDFPEKELRVSPLSLQPTGQRDESLKVAPLSLPSRSRRPGLSCTEPAEQGLPVAPLNIRRRASALEPTLSRSRPSDFEIRPLTIRKVGSSTTPRTTAAASPASAATGTPNTPAEAKSGLLPLLSKSTTFKEPKTLPCRAIEFEEEPSPEVINRHLRTGHIITVTPPEASSPESENESQTPDPIYSGQRPPEDTLIKPERLRVPHTTGKASDFWYRNVAGFPVIGQAPEVVERSWEEIMADDNGLQVPPLNIAKAKSSGDNAPAPPNVSVPPADKSEFLTAPDEASQPRGVETPGVRRGRNPVTPANLPPPPDVSPSSFISPGIVGSQAPSKKPFLIEHPPEFVTSPSQTTRLPDIDASRNPAASSQSSPESAQKTPKKDGGSGWLNKVTTAKAKPVAQAEASSLNKPRTPPASGVRSPGLAGHSSSSLSSQMREGNPESPNPLATRGEEEEESSSDSGDAGSPLHGGAAWSGFPVPSEQSRTEPGQLFQIRVSSVEDNTQQSRSTGGAVEALARINISPEIETEAQRAERGRSFRESLHARQVAALGETEAKARRLRLERDEAIEARLLTQIPQGRAWEEYASKPENRDKECVKIANKMYQAMQEIQADVINDLQRSKADRLHAEIQHLELRSMIDEEEAVPTVPLHEAEATFQELKSQRADCEKEKARMKREMNDLKEEKRERDSSITSAHAQHLRQREEQNATISAYKTEIVSLHKTIQSLNIDFQEAKKKCDAETASLKTQVREQHSEIRKVKNENDKLKRAEREADKQHAENLARIDKGHQKQMDNLSADKKLLEEQVNARDQRIKDCETEKAELRTSASSMVDNDLIRKEIEKKDAKIKSLGEEVARLKADSDGQINVVGKLQRKINDQADDIEQLAWLKERVDWLTEKVAEKERTIETMAEMSGLDSDTRRSLEEINADLTERLRDMEATLNDNWTAREELQNTINRLKEQVELLKEANDELGALRAERDSLAVLDEKLRHKIATTTEKIDDLEGDVGKLEQQVESKDRDIKVLTTLRVQLQRKSDKCESEKASLLNQITSQSTRINELEVEVEAWKVENGQALVEEDAARAKAKRLEEELENVNAVYDQYIRDTKDLEDELETVQKELETTMAAKEKATVLNAKLREFVDQCHKEKAEKQQIIENIHKNFEEKVRMLMEQVDELEEMIKNLGAQNESFKSQLAILQGSDQNYQHQVQTLQAELASVSDRSWASLSGAPDPRGLLQSLSGAQEASSKQLKQIRELQANLKDCREHQEATKEKLRKCEGDQEKRRDEIDNLKNQLRIATAGDGISPFRPPGRRGGDGDRCPKDSPETRTRRGEGEDSGPTYTPRTPSARVARYISAALSDNEDDGRPNSPPTPPPTGPRSVRIRGRSTPPVTGFRPVRMTGDLFSPPGQMVMVGSPQETVDSDMTGISQASMASSSPVDYMGPQPVPASIELAILRAELALGQMRYERAHHGFHHSDSLVLGNTVRDLFGMGERLPSSTDEENKLREHYLARGSYYLGVSYYYRDEAKRAHSYFEDVMARDSEFYSAALIEMWQQRCLETGGPPKEAEYYRDPLYEGARSPTVQRKKAKKSSEGKKPAHRRGSDKSPQKIPKKDDDDIPPT